MVTETTIAVSIEGMARRAVVCRGLAGIDRPVEEEKGLQMLPGVN
jgi:hypothetical protein